MTRTTPEVPETIKVLMPKTHSITLSAGGFVIRPLTIRQIAALTRIIEGVKLPAEPTGLVLKLASQLGSKLPEALAILLSNGEPAPEFIDRCAELTLEDVALLADALAEVNDFVKLRATFQAAVAKMFQPGRTA